MVYLDELVHRRFALPVLAVVHVVPHGLHEVLDLESDRLVAQVVAVLEPIVTDPAHQLEPLYEHQAVVLSGLSVFILDGHLRPDEELVYSELIDFDHSPVRPEGIEVSSGINREATSAVTVSSVKLQ